MNDQERDAILSLCLMAAFADGAKDEREREQIKRIAEGLSRDHGVDFARLYQNVLLKRTTLESAAALLSSVEARQLAYEMSVCVADADGARSERETAFLDSLARALGLEKGAARSFAVQADEIAEAPLAGVPAVLAPVASTPNRSAPDEAALDKSILNAAILNGSLELLPQSLASMAIIPLQMKLVYGIGKAYGYELDRGHLKDFLATLGVGLTSQYVEEIGRKVIGGLLKTLGGGLFGSLGRGATGAAFSFATTYALGHVAKKYYAGGRTIDVDQLKDVFQLLLADAKALQGRYAGEIEQKARTIDTKQLAMLLRQV